MFDIVFNDVNSYFLLLPYLHIKQTDVIIKVSLKLDLVGVHAMCCSMFFSTISEY